MNELEATMSQVTAIYLSSIFENNMVDACNTGFVVKDEHDVSYRIHLKLGMLLQDGAAHKTIYSLKGDAGTKFCIFCANLYTEKSNITMEDNEEVLVANAWSLENIKQATDSDVMGTAQRLQVQSRALSSKDFEVWQQAVGMTFNPYSLLQTYSLARHLQPVSQFVHDWMHCFLVTGIFQTLMHLTLQTLAGALNTDIYSSIATCVGLWKLPAARSSDVASFFSKKRQKSNNLAKSFKFTASEALALGPIFAYYLVIFIVPLDVYSQQCLCMLALVDLIEMIQLVPLNLISVGTLQQACEKFVGLCLKAGYKKHMHTKFHWVLHFPQHLQKHKILPSCFVQERKHKMIKRLWALLCKVSFFTNRLNLRVHKIYVYKLFGVLWFLYVNHLLPWLVALMSAKAIATASKTPLPLRSLWCLKLFAMISWH